MNAATYANLSKYFEVRYVGPLNPPTDYPSKLISKLKRVTGYAGNFHFFSERRLRRIARQVEQGVDAKADCDFFHGPTPWILYDPPRPYFVFTDACFSTYMDIYHTRSLFQENDLNRICEAEAHWLSGASKVFFRTHWALEKTVAAYSIPVSNLSVVGMGGNMPIPDSDSYQGGLDFLFVATDFKNKGGHIAVDAFKHVGNVFPNARLRLVGERPPNEVLQTPGITYEGYLRKTSPADLSRLEAIFSKAFLLIHPTSSDVNPLVIAEAGYYGCPTITAKNFGIPEMLVDSKTGFLVKPPLEPSAFASIMLELCRDSDRYMAMRRAARAHTLENLTWEIVGERIAQQINASFEREKE